MYLLTFFDICHPRPNINQTSSASPPVFLSELIVTTRLVGCNTFSSLQFLSHVLHFVTLWTAACQASLSITNSQSLLKLVSIKSLMPSNHLILCHLLLLLSSIFHSIRIFSNESILWRSAFFTVQLSNPYTTTVWIWLWSSQTIALTRQTFVGKVMSLLFNTLSWS